jgi:alpha-2-macroglobulin-like protein
MKSSRVWFTVFLIFATALLVHSFQAGPAADSAQVAATYAHGVLHLTVPYTSNHAGAGRLIIDVLDPEDHSIGRIEPHVEIAAQSGVWHEDLKLTGTIPLPVEDLVWHRLRYRFSYDQPNLPPLEGTESISRILRQPVLHIFGQRSYFAGAEATVRVIATDSQNRPIPGENSLRIEMSARNQTARTLFSGSLNARGTAQPRFTFPAGLTGNVTLRYAVDTPAGSTEFSEQIQLEDKTSILLTTEKPIYQPGQTIHARALALNRADHQAAAGRMLTFEVQDSRGNKVFKSAAKTDNFGIASAEFSLADEVNLGTYHLRAIMDGGNTSELALNVERYVLPKFKVAVAFADRTKHGYRPGDHVTGTIRANYFFGKPVTDGEIAVKATGLDVAEFDAGAALGKTDAEGAYHFDLKLPDYFAGKPLAGGAARVLIEATVKDSSGHSETRGEPVTVSASPLVVTAVPESGALIPNLENQIFILTSYADGKPAPAQIMVQAAGSAHQSAVSTDESGIAVVHLTPTGAESIRVEASDKEGNRALVSIPLEQRGGMDQILLRAERAVYRSGDRIQLQIFSTRQRGSVYLDVIKEGQTVLTRDLDLHNGQALLTLPATPDLAGAVDFNAYLFGSDARPVADHRLVFVEPPDELKIEASTDRPAYKPGEEAQVRFRVTNSQGEGVAAALGLQVVDEAVFALAEKQPGFAKVFFYLEQEAMKPRYEIHSLGMPEVIAPVARPLLEQRDRAARALFAATEIVNRNQFETEAGKNVGAEKYPAYAARYRAQFAEKTPAQLTAAYAHRSVDLITASETGPAVADFWGTTLRLERVAWNPHEFAVRSAGPDKKFNNEDDLEMNVLVHGGDFLSATETIAVTAAPRPAPPMMRRMAAFAGALGGVGGGVIGGVPGGVPQAMMVQPMAANLPLNSRASGTLKELSAQPAAHVRSYFPEALYINPEIITDAHGLASITIPLADSITTWRMAMLASTPRGALGSGTSSIKVFQDFFTDLDLPVTLTQGDRVSIPVAIYNYSGAPGDVHLKLKIEDWFQLVEDAPEKTVAAEPDRVAGSQFTIEAKRIGKFKLTLSANMNHRADIVVREIEVVPNGREQTVVFNGRLDSAAAHEVNFPANAIPDANTVLVRLYPGPLSQVIEGMDAILRMPGGCFEQTSSSTYPNVLALDYMKRTHKSTPEIHAKAEGFIASGYQRLLTFEVPGGGFSWFGQAPANKILTAYGLMEFSDMSKVYDVDSKVIARTQQWLAAQQQPDGSWKPDTNFINEGATNRYNSDVLRITAYIAWSLENTGYRGPAVEKARQFISQSDHTTPDAYTLAVIANFAADGNDRALLDRAIQKLVAARTEKDQQAWWTTEETGVYSRGASAAIETTGLAVQALLKSGQESAVAQKALTYIASKKNATGAWGSTQATIMALRAVLLSTEKGSADVRGAVEISVNGTPVQTLTLTPENNDLLHQFAFKNAGGKNAVEIRFRGTGGLAYQIAGRYFVPWTEKPLNEPLSITVNYDRTRLSQDDVATATAVIRNNLNKTANMVMVDLGIPPGFDLLSEDLQDYKEKTAARKSGRLEKFSLTATQAILYFDSVAATDTVTLKFRLRAKFPIRARTFQSRVYEYYDPAVSAVAQPVQLEIRKQ